MEDPPNLGDSYGWASSASVPDWSPCPRRRRGDPVHKRRQRYGPKDKHEPPRRQPKNHYGGGSWFQPPRMPSWAMDCHWGIWGGPWHPHLAAVPKPRRQVQMIRVCTLPPLCLCCCACWFGPWNQEWMGTPGRKKRWGRRSHGLRRQPGRSFQRNRPTDNKLLRPANLRPRRWRVPGMQAPPNTTQFIMNQIYEDMRQQEQLERQQQAQAEGQATLEGSSEHLMPFSGSEEDSQNLWGFVPDPLLLSPAPAEENQSLIPQQVEEAKEKNEEEYDKVVYDEKEESEEEEEDEVEEEAEDEDNQEERQELEEDEEEQVVQEADYVEETKEEGVEDAEKVGLGRPQVVPREEETPLSLEMPLSILVGAEEENESLINYSYFSPEQLYPQLPQEALFMLPDINC